MSQQFPHLFSPIKLGSMTVPNRIVVPSHSNGYVTEESGWFPDPISLGYWELKAKGGAGLINLGCWGVHPSSSCYPDQNDPQYVEKLKRLVDIVKKHGSCFTVQIWHSGCQATGALHHMPEAGPWSSCSEAVTDIPANNVHEMTKDEIKELIEAFARTAALVKKTGVDGLEIHAAHQYLPEQFYSPVLNYRTDEYGGSEENRLRFLMELIDAVRSAIGNDLTLGIRIDGDQFRPGGVTIDDMTRIIPKLNRKNQLDYFNVSLSGLGCLPPMYFPLGFAVYLASAIKKVVDVPVMTVGRINDPVQAETILAEGHADLVCMNRAIICDPYFPKKAREGRVDEIRTCMGDMEGCWQRVLVGITCTYNPVIGRELEPGWAELIPAEKKKKVMVVGGGPAGLETARVAAERGHQVSLWEKGDELGGQVLIAAKAPGRDGFLELPRYYTYQMKLNKIDVHLNTEVTADTVMKENPDVLVIATGSYPKRPRNIPGINQDNVVTVRDVLTGKAEVGQNVVVSNFQPSFHGGTCAEFLADQGKTVTVFSPLRDVQATQLDIPTSLVLRQRLMMKGVKLVNDEGVAAISGNTVTVANFLTEEARTLEGVDTVVISYGDVDYKPLYYELKDKFKEIHLVGDARGPRKLMYAVEDGAKVGRII